MRSPFIRGRVSRGSEVTSTSAVTWAYRRASAGTGPRRRSAPCSPAEAAAAATQSSTAAADTRARADPRPSATRTRPRLRPSGGPPGLRPGSGGGCPGRAPVRHSSRPGRLRRRLLVRPRRQARACLPRRSAVFPRRHPMPLLPGGRGGPPGGAQQHGSGRQARHCPSDGPHGRRPHQQRGGRPDREGGRHEPEVDRSLHSRMCCAQPLPGAGVHGRSAPGGGQLRPSGPGVVGPVPCPESSAGARPGAARDASALPAAVPLAGIAHGRTRSRRSEKRRSPMPFTSRSSSTERNPPCEVR